MESKKYEFLKTVFLMACLLYIFSAIKALQSYRLVVGTIWGMIFDKYCRFFTEFNGFRDILKVRAKYRNFGRKTLDGLKIVFVSCAL